MTAAPDADRAEIDRRLFEALHSAGRSALGMPTSVETLKAMLQQCGLALVLRSAPNGR